VNEPSIPNVYTKCEWEKHGMADVTCRLCYASSIEAARCSGFSCCRNPEEGSVKVCFVHLSRQKNR
jgi:hypothetical protein